MLLLWVGLGVILASAVWAYGMHDQEKSWEREIESEARHQRMMLLRRVRRDGIRYEIKIAQAPHLDGWRWTVWDADAALLPPGRDAGVVFPYAAGTAPTKVDAEAQALAEIEGLRLQERVDEVFVV